MKRALIAWCLVLPMTLIAIRAPAQTANDSAPIAPDRAIELFNGRDLSGWTTWLVDTRREDPRGVFPVRVDARVTRDRSAEGAGPPRFDPSGQLEVFRKGWIRWSGRDPGWRDVFGFRGRHDVESPGGQWTRIESICQGDRITVSVNGTRVNEAHNVLPSAGKILLQCEGSEVFFRKVELHPLAQRPVASVVGTQSE